jgi:flagellar hook-length control protein FliK
VSFDILQKAAGDRSAAAGAFDSAHAAAASFADPLDMQGQEGGEALDAWAAFAQLVQDAIQHESAEQPPASAGAERTDAWPAVDRADSDSARAASELPSGAPANVPAPADRPQTAPRPDATRARPETRGDADVDLTMAAAIPLLFKPLDMGRDLASDVAQRAASSERVSPSTADADFDEAGPSQAAGTGGRDVDLEVPGSEAILGPDPGQDQRAAANDAPPIAPSDDPGAKGSAPGAVRKTKREAPDSVPGPSPAAADLAGDPRLDLVMPGNLPASGDGISGSPATANAVAQSRTQDDTQSTSMRPTVLEPAPTEAGTPVTPPAPLAEAVATSSQTAGVDGGANGQAAALSSRVNGDAPRLESARIRRLLGQSEPVSNRARLSRFDSGEAAMPVSLAGVSAGRPASQTLPAPQQSIPDGAVRLQAQDGATMSALHDPTGSTPGQDLPAPIAALARGRDPVTGAVQPVLAVGSSPLLQSVPGARDLFRVAPSFAGSAIPNESGVQSAVVQGIRMQWRDGEGTAVIKLDPAYLGTVTVTLRVEGGSVSATLQAENPQVRAWIATNESSLRLGLADQGLALERLAIGGEPSADPRFDEREQRRSGREPDVVEQKPKPRSTHVFEVVV